MCPCCDWPPPPTVPSLSGPLRLPGMVIHHTDPGRRWQGGGVKFRHELIWVWIKCRWNWFTLLCVVCQRFWFKCPLFPQLLSHTPLNTHLFARVHAFAQDDKAYNAAWDRSCEMVRKAKTVILNVYFGLQLSHWAPAVWWICHVECCCTQISWITFTQEHRHTQNA